MRLALPPESCKVYTPSPLADAMIAALGDKPHLQWLEPSHGKGAFVEALARRGISKARIIAIDLDPTSAPGDKFAKVFRGVDFLRWATRTDCRFDRIVGNPPYIAISQLPVSLRGAAAGSALARTYGMPLSSRH
jgi:methylase of polypeptide subunit release factors